MIKLGIEQSEEVGRQLGLLIDGAARRAVLGAANRIVQRITTVVIPAEPRPPIDRRVYAAGFRAKPIPEGALLENTVPWASIVEEGARAENIKVGRKMIDALAEWVIRKRMVGVNAGGKKNVDVKAEARRIAWAIAMTMKKNGIFNRGKGLKIVEKGLKSLEAFFVDELKTELARET